MISAPEGPIDVASALEPTRRPEAFAFLYGVLHRRSRSKGMLLLGSSDGARVWIDRKLVSSTDWSRPERATKTSFVSTCRRAITRILIKLHHRDGYWASRVRVVDTTLAAPPGAYLRLPGTGDGDSRSLAQKMTAIEVNRGLQASGFRPTVTVSFPEGLPRGIDRSVHVSATLRSQGKSKQPLRPGCGPSASRRVGAERAQGPTAQGLARGDRRRGERRRPRHLGRDRRAQARCPVVASTVHAPNACRSPNARSPSPRTIAAFSSIPR